MKISSDVSPAGLRLACERLACVVSIDECLLYMDDVHTRGSDFRLPRGRRALVALGKCTRGMFELGGPLPMAC